MLSLGIVLYMFVTTEDELIQHIENQLTMYVRNLPELVGTSGVLVEGGLEDPRGLLVVGGSGTGHGQSDQEKEYLKEIKLIH